MPVFSPVSSFAFLAGASTWSAAEYALHRFVGHGPRRRRGEGLLARVSPGGFLAEFAAEHTAHHANPTYFAATWKKVLAATVAVPTLGGLASVVVGPRRGFSFAVGFASAYLGYELLHRRIHTAPPRSKYERWVYRNHLSHHVSPKVNHGVTVGLWDHALGSHRPSEGPIALHVKIAPAWLTDPETGGVRAAFARDFSVLAPKVPRAPGPLGVAGQAS
jgi:hypothetical protein